jgi:hypothetical protein
MGNQKKFADMKIDTEIRHVRNAEAGYLRQRSRHLKQAAD